MALYQNSVLKKYLKQQDSEAVAKAFKKFSKYFHDPKIQENIRSSKEEEYQGIFLTELFSKILGYTMKPNANFNLVAEYKNEKNSRKADGAILKDNEALGVIELKGTNTKDLEKVRQQAFDYKANQTGCVYVITSNFEKIRFYINNAVDFEEFDLFNLNQERFELLYLCLAQENLSNNIPLKIKEASVQEEEAITKKFYKDYSTFKRELFRDLVKLNMKNEVFRAELNNEDADRANKNIKHNLFKKSQKLIDRFLFIFFAEDRGLLPPNSTVQILEQWNRLKDDDAYFPLYHRYKLYFNYLDQGRAGKNGKAEIFAYNGGLFKPDAVLDSLEISDELLYKHTNALQAYDFESQVDVNILGHIFENSLNEIESVNAEIEGTDFDKQTTKRKKDGVFYTPKYITKYIVDNTVGKLCTDKKTELGVIEEEYLKIRKGRSKAKLKELLDSLEAYREWLLQITILDPACGSGAFLNQALDFLIKEHQYIDELQTNLLGGGFVFPDIENTVLENNIFGVDLNEESVEIAKLSLWLRTAQPRRKLNDLSSNIKCGNSLIDSKTEVGDKAFKWENEFVHVFSEGGFDVVIGNPPYVSHDRVDNKKYLSATYESHQGFADLFCYFYELGVKLLKKDGVLSFITSNSFLKAEYGAPLRNFLLNNSTLLEIINVEDAQVFSDAIVNSSILSLQKNSNKKGKCLIVNKKYELSIDFWSYIESNKFYYEQLDFDELPWNLIRPETLKLRNKIKGENLTLEELDTKIRLGLATGSNEAFIVTEEIKRELITQDPNSVELIKPMLRGKDIEQYYYNLPPLYLLLTKNGIDVQEDYPAIYNHLDSFGESFKNRGAKGQHWTNLRACSFFDDFKKEKIVWIELTDKGRFSKCTDEIYLLNSAYFLLPPKGYSIGYLITLLNSKLIKFYLKQIANTSGVGTARWINIYVKEFPIYEANIEIQTECDNLEKTITNKLISHNNINKAFTKYIQSQIKLEKISRKLQNWHTLEFGDFIKELNKAIKKAGGAKLTKMDEMEWMDVFETKKAEAQTLKAEIDKTDAEIDAMVYELYGLSEEEIKIVENN
ncbi:MAG: restriction endonuclease subunit M [Thalassobium sp.]|nr:MAG: restriction endonuclease subunit M [Thalassobium sp.]